MAVGKFIQPDFETQTGTQYKTNLDNCISVSERFVNMFAPREQDTPNMSVYLGTGALFIDGAIVDMGAQSSATISAPSTNPRIDRVVIGSTVGTISIIGGVEAGSPSPPAIPDNKLPIAQISLATSTTSITNDLITDERLSGLFGDLTQDMSGIRPVNSIYVEIANVNPATTLGFGTWEALGQEFDDTLLNMHFERRGATFADDGPFGLSVTASGGATQSATQKKFGSKSLYLPGGATDYIEVGTAAFWAAWLNSREFMLDLWAYGDFSGNGGGLYYWDDNNLIRVRTTGVITAIINGSAQEFGTLTVNTWQHIRAVYRDGVLRIALDGTFHAASLTQPFSVASALRIGNQGGYYWIGYLDEPKIFNRALAVSNFTPPTVPYRNLYRWLRTA